MSDQKCPNCEAKDQTIKDHEKKIHEQKEIIKDLMMRLGVIEETAKRERDQAQAEMDRGKVPQGRFAFLKGQVAAYDLILSFCGLPIFEGSISKGLHKLNQFVRGGNYGKR